MSTVRQLVRVVSQRRAAIAFALLTASIAACDARPTAPAAAELRRAPSAPAAIEGDTLRCLKGWVVINGFYVCNEDA